MALFDGFNVKEKDQEAPATPGLFADFVVKPQTLPERMAELKARGETISAAPAPGKIETLFKRFTPQPVKDIAQTLKVGLFGEEVQDMRGRTYQKSGLLVKGEDFTPVDLIPFSGFRPKSDLQKFNEREAKLISEGIAPSRAAEIAHYSSGEGINPKGPFNGEKKKREQERGLAALNLTDDERKILRNIGLFEIADKALSSLDFIGVGSIKNLSRTAVQKIAASSDLAVISKILQKEVPDLGSKAADEFAKVFKHIDDPADVQTAINRMDFQIKSAKKTPPSPTDSLFPAKTEATQTTPLIGEGSAAPVRSPEIAAKTTAASGRIDLAGDGSDLPTVEKNVEKYVLDNKNDLITEYRAQHGNVYNVDNMKELIPSHAENRTISEAFHKPAAEVMGDMVRQAIDENAGKGNKVVFFGGATAAGKSTALEGLAGSDEFLGQTGPIIDGTLADTARSAELIGKALGTGQDVQVFYIENNPQRIMDNAIARAQEGGRTVPVETIFNTLLKSRQNVARLNGKFGTNPNFNVTVIDNSADAPVVVENGVAFLRGKSYSLADIERFKADAYDRLTKLYDEQAISEKVYSGFTRRRPEVSSKGVRERNGEFAGEESQAQRRSEKGSKEGVSKAPKADNIATIKRISAEKSSGPIIDILSEDYKNLSTRTIEAFADRLAKLKDTDAITGLLAVLSKIDESVGKGVTLTYTKEVLPKTAGKPVDVSRLYRMLEREEESLAAAQANPAGHAKAYGPGKVAEYKEKIASLKDRIKAAKKPEDDVIPPSMGDLLSHKERASYLDNLARTIKNPQEAALARAEYDELWSKLNARAVVEYESLSIEREILEEALNQNQGGQLIKYFGPKNNPADMTLAELLIKSQGKDVKAARLDSYATELGFKDLDDAQEGLDSYLAMRERVREIKDKMRDLRPEVQTARLLKDFLDDVPVVEDNSTLVAIDQTATGSKVRDEYKDISGFEKEALDPPRIFKKFFGREYPVVKEAILNPFDDAKGKMVDEINKLSEELNTGAAKKFNIQRGTKDAQYVRMYGEGKMDRQDLINTVGEERAKEIVSADAFFRGWYDRLLDEANAVLARIYPNNPEKLIPKHSNYYRHLRDKNSMSESLAAIKNLFDTPAGISPELAGLSEFTKPRMKFLQFAQSRKGEKTDTDAIEGAIDYIASFAYLKHISPEISKFRYLRRRLADVAPTPGDTQFDGIGKERGINNMLVFLDNFSNKLAGKSHPLDRWISDTIPGGRPAMNAITMVNNRVKRNTILFKAGSAVAQLANVPAGIAKAKQYFLPGARRTLGSIFQENEAIKQSNFIKERTLGSLKETFKTAWFTDKPLFDIDKLDTGIFDKRISGERAKEEILQLGGWILRSIDTIGTHFIWNGFYEKARGLGIEDAVRYADNETRAIVGGRGIGEVPLGQESKVFQTVAPFSLEVGNLWWIMRDMVKEKDFAGLILLFIGNYIYNEISEEVRGSRVTYDPINALVEGTAMLADEDSLSRGVVKFAGRQAGEVLSNVPFGQTIAGQIPESTVENMTSWVSGGGLTKRELFGQGDPGRFGSGLLIFKALEDPLTRFVLPAGGAQLDATIGGINAYINGEVEDRAGRPNFKIDRNATNLIKAILFGKNATNESREFFDTREELFQIINEQDAARRQLAADAEDEWKRLRELGKEEGKLAVKAEIKAIAAGNEPLAKKIIEIIEDEIKGLDGVDRLIKMLGVENGERAKYVYETMKDLDTKEEQKAYLKELADKRLVSETVIIQIAELKKREKSK